MAYDSDHLVDRRRLKRHLTFWRALAVVALAAGIAAAFGRFGGDAVGSDYIARLDIKGTIVQDDKRLETLDKLAEDDSVRAVILRIDSPGGTVTGGETLYRAILDLGKQKPVVSVMDGVATSAAYMVALGSERIFAQESTITGSIGVILQTAEISRLLEMVGVTPKAFKSGPLKASPNPLEPVSPDSAAAMQSLIDEMYGMFRDMVMMRRNLDPADEKIFADGRVFTGRQALRARLVDEIGDERAAVVWLKAEKDLPVELEVRQVKARDEVSILIQRLDGLARKTILSERLTLDGLLSVWHPEMQ